MQLDAADEARFQELSDGILEACDGDTILGQARQGGAPALSRLI